MSSRTRMSRLGASMSAREKETLVLLTKGYSAIQIADTLSLTPNYIYSMIRLLKVRFDANTATGVVLHAIAEGVINTEGKLLEE